MNFYVVILALATTMVYAVPVEKQQEEFESVTLIPVDNVEESVQSSENSDDISVKRYKRHLPFLTNLINAKIDLINSVLNRQPMNSGGNGGYGSSFGGSNGGGYGGSNTGGYGIGYGGDYGGGNGGGHNVYGSGNGGGNHYGISPRRY